MIYVFSGTDTKKRSEALNKFLKGFREHELVKIDETNFSESEFGNFISGNDMFAKKYLVAFENILEESVGETVLEKIKELKSSENVFVFIESEIGKETLAALKKNAEEIETFDLPKWRDNKFNIFQITDAFGARDKKTTWVLMQKALRENISAEEILNILIWQVKNLLFVRGTLERETGLNPFVYKKSSSYTKNFKDGELENISKNLTRLFHESHLGLELSPNLELLILKSL